MNILRILGIDPGIAIVGFGVIEYDNNCIEQCRRIWYRIIWYKYKHDSMIIDKYDNGSYDCTKKNIRVEEYQGKEYRRLASYEEYEHMQIMVRMFIRMANI